MQELEKINDKNRQFVCSCEKAYLSYAALFTHIKHKHNGQVRLGQYKAPGPIVRPRSQRKRGRPKKTIDIQYPFNQNIRILPNINISSPNKIFFDKQLQIIQQGSIKNIQQRTRQSVSLLGCGQFQTFKPFGLSSAFSVYNSQLPQNSQILLHRFKSETLPLKKQKQYDFDNISEKSSRPKIIHSCKLQQNFYKNIILRLIQLCKKLNSDQLTMLKVSFQYSRAFQIYIKCSQSSHSKNQQYIINKIKTFHKFLKENMTQQNYYQIFIVVVLVLDNILDNDKQQQYLMTESLQSFIEFIHNFFQISLQQQINQRRLQIFNISKKNNPMQVFIEFFNYISVNRYFIQLLSFILHQQQSKESKQDCPTSSVY